MDSRFIEVAIGLALTFALLSLLATAVMEGVSSIRNHRGATLEKLVISMLGDDGELARKFFNHTLMQSMVQGDRRPSYVPSDVFTTTLLNVLSDGLAVKPRTGTPADFIDAVKSSPLGKRRETKALFSTMDVLLQGVEHDWASFELAVRKWFDQAGERSSGWYKRGNTIWLFVIGVILAVGLNIDSLRIATALWNDPVLRQKTVTQAQIALDDYEKQRTKGQPTNSLPGPESAPLSGLPGGPDGKSTSPDGKSPGSKGVVTKAPSAPAAGGGVDTAATTRAAPQAGGSVTLMEGKMQPLEGKSVLKGAPTGSLSPKPVVAPEAADSLKLAQDVIGKIDTSVSSSGNVSKEALSFAMLDMLALNAQLSQARPVPGEVASVGAKPVPNAAPDCRDDDVSEACKIARAARAIGQLQSAGIPMGWSGPFPTQHVTAATGDSKYYLFILNFAAMLAGWLVTAVAVTLGAPFWFDTLSKLVKLRGSGAKGETEAQKPAAAAPPPGTAGPAAAGGIVAGDGDSLSPDERKLSTSEIEVIQQRLGVPNNQVTGRFDATTRTFIGRWQETQGLQRTSLLTAQQINLLLTQGPVRTSSPSASTPAVRSDSRLVLRQPHVRVGSIAANLMAQLGFPGRIPAEEKHFSDDLRALAVLYRYKKEKHAKPDLAVQNLEVFRLARSNPAVLNELDETLAEDVVSYTGDTPRFAREVAGWIDWAIGELGQVEKNSTRRETSNPRICQYLDAAGPDGGNGGDRTSWCGAFVAWVLTMHINERGAANFPSLPPEPLGAPSWERWGQQRGAGPGALAAAVQGDVVVVRVVGTNSGRHVGFVFAKEAGAVWVLGGNQKDGTCVCLSRFPAADIVDIRRA